MSEHAAHDGKQTTEAAPAPAREERAADGSSTGVCAAVQRWSTRSVTGCRPTPCRSTSASAPSRSPACSAGRSRWPRGAGTRLPLGERTLQAYRTPGALTTAGGAARQSWDRAVGRSGGGSDDRDGGEVDPGGGGPSGFMPIPRVAPCVGLGAQRGGVRAVGVYEDVGAVARCW